MQINLSTIKYVTALAICHSSSCGRCRDVFGQEECPRDGLNVNSIAEEMIALYRNICNLCSDADSIEITDKELMQVLEL